jgi:hypothetical protein
LYSFKGPVANSTIGYFIDKIERDPSVPEKAKTRFKLVMIELITNILNHFYLDNYCEIDVEREESALVSVTTKNFISEADLEHLRNKIAQLNNAGSVKELYLQALKNTSENHSVNLGIMYVYQKSNGRLSFAMEKKGNNFLLILKTTLNV